MSLVPSESEELVEAITSARASLDRAQSALEAGDLQKALEWIGEARADCANAEEAVVYWQGFEAGRDALEEERNACKHTAKTNTVDGEIRCAICGETVPGP